MKVRHSFVSNSSSQSFIITKCDKFPDILTLAEFMSEIRRIDDNEGWYKWKYEAVKKSINRLRFAAPERLSRYYQKLFSFPKGVRFSSCNYDTFIYDYSGSNYGQGNEFWVSTCNNHPFYHYLSSYRNMGRENDCDINAGYDNKSWIEFYLGKSFEFLDLEQ